MYNKCKLCGKETNPNKLKGKYCSNMCSYQDQAELLLVYGLSIIWTSISLEILVPNFPILTWGWAFLGLLCCLVYIPSIGLKIKNRYPLRAQTPFIFLASTGVIMSVIWLILLGNLDNTLTSVFFLGALLGIIGTFSLGVAIIISGIIRPISTSTKVSEDFQGLQGG
ncbi:MAG: hypothetical protein ACTSR2_04345 [Candidatus Hodarchaeales archaeon]